MLAAIAPPAPWAGVLLLGGLLVMVGSGAVVLHLQRRAIEEAYVFHRLPAEARRGLRRRTAFQPTVFDQWLARWSLHDPELMPPAGSSPQTLADSSTIYALGWLVSSVLLFTVVVLRHNSHVAWQDVFAALSVVLAGALLVFFSRRPATAASERKSKSWSRNGDQWLLAASSVPIWIALIAH